MNRVIRYGLIFLFVLRAFGLDYGIDKTLELKKDEVFKAVVEDTSSHQAKEVMLYWTLYKNKGLVVIMHFNGFPHQFVLYTDYARNTYNLKVFEENFALESHLSLVFRDFKEDKAILRLLAPMPLAFSSKEP
ncbi:hypothetical protein [Helicobacter cetorum]|uniref:Uncharacterized protein n=1 Tax=Helicobacter cetorum (strain ATCC BAA-540 / CCUG 52418 / MIT 99-5656) TaxID=1163745 RepID=I0ETH8_HELCM|nr:hypothetical protein [Helicobacter cetorum]AFI06247.1 hypothetical protein HCD_06225 [Helicobacter cetorum MIT 99-5656]